MGDSRLHTRQGARLELKILGPLEAIAEGRVVDIRGQKQRELLAILRDPRERGRLGGSPYRRALGREHHPSSAVKTLQAYVSRLRKALGPQTVSLTTHGHGYSLSLAAGALDAERFATLARGGTPSACRRRAATARWKHSTPPSRCGAARCSPTSRYDVVRAARDRAPRRAPARSSRGAGGGRPRAWPTRTRRSARLESACRRSTRCASGSARQLMLALYSSGRQAEALQVYQEGRRTLAEELGLEPSRESLQRLERQILEHDPALAPAVPDPRPTVTSELEALAVGDRHGVAALLVVLGARVQRLVRATPDDAATRRGRCRRARPRDRRDPRERRARHARRETSQSARAASGCSTRTTRRSRRSIPSPARSSEPSAPSSTPTDIAVGAGAVWVGNASERQRRCPRVCRGFDTDSSVPTATIELAPRPLRPHLRPLRRPQARHRRVTRRRLGGRGRSEPVCASIRVRTNASREIGRGKRPTSRRARETSGSPSGQRPRRDRSRSRTPCARRIARSTASGPLAIGGGAVWMRIKTKGSCASTRTHRLSSHVVELGPWISDVSFGEGAVWATSEIEDAVYRIDPRDVTPMRIEATAPRAWRTGDGVVWATVAAPPSRDAALPSSVCSDVYFERLGSSRTSSLVSDLTLKGDGRPWTQAMVDGMRYTLEQRGFEAGALSVGYQSCDSATAQAGGIDFFRCATNAKAYARNLRVVAVFGSFQSRRARTPRSRSRTRPRADRSRCSARRTQTAASRPTTTCTRRARGASSASRRRTAWTGSRRG